jgi:hypothetical protein
VEVPRCKGGLVPVDPSDQLPKLHIVLDYARAVLHRNFSETLFGIPNGVMGAKIDFEFIEKYLKIPHPMRRVGQVHETGFEPTDCRAIEIGKDEKDFLLVVGEGVRAVAEVEVA